MRHRRPGHARGRPLYTAEQRRRRDASRWTLVQGVLAPLQFAVFLVSLCLVLRYLATGDGLALATASVVAKTLVLYAIMVTGSIWEREVFGRYLFAPAFFWEDVVSILVLALHTAYLGTLLLGWLGRRGSRCAWRWPPTPPTSSTPTQFLLKLRAARLSQDAAPAEAALRARRVSALRRPGAEAARTVPVAARARPARGVLRADRHHLAAPQDPGRLLPGRRLAHLRPPDPVGGGRDDLRRAALRHRDHRGARPRRAGRRQRRARPGRRPAARAAAGHQAAVPGRLLPVGGHQARPVARRRRACRQVRRRTSAC